MRPSNPARLCNWSLSIPEWFTMVWMGRCFHFLATPVFINIVCCIRCQWWCRQDLCKTLLMFSGNVGQRIIEECPSARRWWCFRDANNATTFLSCSIESLLALVQVYLVELLICTFHCKVSIFKFSSDLFRELMRFTHLRQSPATVVCGVVSMKYGSMDSKVCKCSSHSPLLFAHECKRHRRDSKT